jgi:outer membrane protein assembly factor BamD
MRHLQAIILAACCVTLLSAGCGGKKQLSAEETFASGNENFEAGAYEVAIESYKELLDQHPFDEKALEAETKIALAYYLMGRYAEAIAAFSDFERMHPTDPQIPVVTYYLGMAYLKQMRPIDRDQAASSSAHAYFGAVIDRYPSSPWAERARLRRRECEETLGAHELYVASFYLRQKNLGAAEARLAHLLQDYPGTDAAAQALSVFGKEYLKRDMTEPATLAFLALVQNHPDDPLAIEAGATLTRLDGNGTSDDLSGDPLQMLVARLTHGPQGLDDAVTESTPAYEFVDTTQQPY